MSTPFVVRPIPVWTEKETHPRKVSPFQSPYSDTLVLLAKELRQVDAREVVLEVVAGPEVLRKDGGMRADAKVSHPGVILSFESKHGPLRYVTDVFTSRGSAPWQENLRAIALGLEALRKVDRYGISSSGEQYRGWTALGAAPHTEDGGAPRLDPPVDVHAMSTDDAARWILAHLGSEGVFTVHQVLIDPAVRKRCYRALARKMHPDAGGTVADFQLLQAIQRLLG